MRRIKFSFYRLLAVEREKQKFEEYERQQKDASKASETIEIVMENKKLIE